MKRKNASINLPPNSPLIVSSTPLQSEKSEQQQQRYRTQPNPSRTSPFISRNPTPVLTKQNNYQHMHLLSKQRHNFLIYKTPNTLRSEHYQSTLKTTASSTIQRLQTEIGNKNSAPWKRGNAYTSLCPWPQLSMSWWHSAKWSARTYQLKPSRENWKSSLLISYHIQYKKPPAKTSAQKAICHTCLQPPPPILDPPLIPISRTIAH